ncbi:hypothetical protein [Methylobacterium sp. ARG-1]|uniref:hypothetical protein n=1 Tax=Methylobacterium sp. ARG-1 TaxID=1692501 RepID=UPI00068151C7|nr:hypothetical protein [Methylobacterium sp. ARG-1]KNY22711.1 hypothetical protein AKJ13_10660 [Methylobacterium sp. ARG-1]
MSKLTLSRCASLVAIFAVLGALLAAGPGWGRPSPSATATFEPSVLAGPIALALAMIGGWVLARFWSAAASDVGLIDLHGLRLDESGAVIAFRQDGEADAVAEAVRIFQDGLVTLSVQPAQPTSADTIESLAEMTAQASVVALRATLAAAQAGGGFAVAAARARELSEEAAAVSEAITVQAPRVAGAPDQDWSGIEGIADPIRALSAASASPAAMAARPESPRPEPSSGRTYRLGSSIRAA